MDPLSITFGVIGTTAIALHSARRVCETVDGIRGAPGAVESLGRDVHDLAAALENLSSILRKFEDQQRNAQLRMLPMLQSPLDSCVSTLQDIETKIKPFDRGKWSVWRGFTWTFREKDILSLQTILMSQKQSLDIAISIADFSNNRDDFDEVKQKIQGLHRKLDSDRDSMALSSYPGSTNADSDHAYALKKWLRDTETVFDDLASVQDEAEPITKTLNDDDHTPSIKPPLLTAQPSLVDTIDDFITELTMDRTEALLIQSEPSAYTRALLQSGALFKHLANPHPEQRYWLRNVHNGHFLGSSDKLVGGSGGKLRLCHPAQRSSNGLQWQFRASSVRLGSWNIYTRRGETEYYLDASPYHDYYGTGVSLAWRHYNQIDGQCWHIPVDQEFTRTLVTVWITDRKYLSVNMENDVVEMRPPTEDVKYHQRWFLEEVMDIGSAPSAEFGFLRSSNNIVTT